MNRLCVFSLLALIAIAAHVNADPIEPKYKGKPLAYWVERLQKGQTDAEQYEAADAIAAFGADADSAVPKLVEMLDDRSAEYRKLITYWVLRPIAPDAKSVVPAMIKLLKEKRARDPELVIEVLQCAGPKARDAVPELIDALADDKVTIGAIHALCAIGPAAKDAIPAIGKAVRKSGDNYAIRSFYLLGPDVVPLLCEMLGENNNARRISAVYGLGQLGSPAKAAVPQLVKLLKEESEDIRLESAWALWTVAKHPDAVPALISILRDSPGSDACLGAIYSLGKIGPEAKAAIPSLRAYRGFYEKSAIDALGEIEGKKAVEKSPSPAFPQNP